VEHCKGKRDNREYFEGGLNMLKIKIDTGNAAFEENPSDECARILEDAALKLRQGNNEIPLHDINGNLVGICKLTKR
jgi:hypothetical protein